MIPAKLGAGRFKLTFDHERYDRKFLDFKGGAYSMIRSVSYQNMRPVSVRLFIIFIGYVGLISYAVAEPTPDAGSTQGGSSGNQTGTQAAPTNTTSSSATNSQVALKEPHLVLVLSASRRLAVRAVDLLLALAGKSPIPAPRVRRAISKTARY